jgi:hypothetical protein
MPKFIVAKEIKLHYLEKKKKMADDNDVDLSPYEDMLKDNNKQDVPSDGEENVSNDKVDTAGMSKLKANIIKKGSNSYYYAQYVVSI